MPTHVKLLSLTRPATLAFYLLTVALPGALACSGSEPASAGTTAGSAGSSGASAAGGTAGAATAGSVSVGGGGASAGSVGASGASGAGGSLGGAGAATAGASGSAGSGGSAGAIGLTGNVDIMVLGSSNELITCWRAFLWQKLQAAEIKNFDFVGGVTQGDDCGVAGYDKDLQAQSGIIVSNLPASKFQEWFTAHPPDIILMHFGGADLLNNMPVDGVLKAYSLMLTEARKVKPKVRLMAAQHTPQDSNGCTACDASVLDLNAKIVTWAAANTTADSPVTPIDLYTDIVPATDLSDGVHLNPAGSQKVAARFFAALKPLFKP
jgi:lysophospholipase L1-like esterase